MIEKNRLIRLVNIEKNRKEALAKLNLQYATADKAKTTIGYIVIMFNAFIWGCIIINDLMKLVGFFYDESKIYLKEKREQKENRKRENVNANIQMEIVRSEQLQEKLDKFHIKLVKACAKRRALENRRKL